MSALVSTIGDGIARGRQHRLLGPLSIVALAMLVTLGLRVAVNGYEQFQIREQISVAQQAAREGMPTNAQIEQAWGIRITTVQLLADHGLVEIRYLVVDSTKAAKLHADTTSLKNIPFIRIEGTNHEIKSTSVMFHFQHGVGNGVEGHTYSIIYGNANGWIKPYSLVSIVMPDGLALQHVPVGS